MSFKIRKSLVYTQSAIKETLKPFSRREAPLYGRETVEREIQISHPLTTAEQQFSLAPFRNIKLSAVLKRETAVRCQPTFLPVFIPLPCTIREPPGCHNGKIEDPGFPPNSVFGVPQFHSFALPPKSVEGNRNTHRRRLEESSLFHLFPSLLFGPSFLTDFCTLWWLSPPLFYLPSRQRGGGKGGGGGGGGPCSRFFGRFFFDAAAFLHAEADAESPTTHTEVAVLHPQEINLKASFYRLRT